MKYKEKAFVISQQKIAGGIYDLRLKSENIAGEAHPGQFVSVYCHDGSRLLPRPISICGADASEGTIRLVYRVAGKGTLEFSGYQEGDEVELIGPLGNGFPLEAAEGKRCFLIGGGIGIPPILELAKRLDAEADVILGYRDERFLEADFRSALTVKNERRSNPSADKDNGSRVFIATEDGSAGTKGTVIDCIRENGLKADVLFACGPTPMLRALKEFAESNRMEAYLSLEQRMACGVGACLGCVCKSADIDEHSKVANKRVCAEGPVFRAEDIVL